jgi:hypothetical protein
MEIHHAAHRTRIRLINNRVISYLLEVRSALGEYDWYAFSMSSAPASRATPRIL